MQMNPGIILQSQQPDMINVLGRSNEVAQQRIGFDRQNAINALYQEQGPGIAAGDQNALNALAQFDPSAAIGVQDARLGMDATRQTMQIQAEQARRQAEEYARGISAEQRAAEAAQLEQGLSGAAYFYSQGDRAGYERFLQEQGIDPTQFDFEQFPAHAAMMGGVLDVLKGFQPESQTLALGDRYKVVGGSLFDLGAEGGPQPVGQGAMQEETIFGPDGKPLIVRGGPGTGAKFTESQSKDIGFATRMRGAEDLLAPVENALTNFGDRALGADPTGIVRGTLQSREYQLARQAGQTWLLAFLRKDSGAATTQEEDALYGETFLPQPGDSAEVIAQKRQVREIAMNAVEAGMGPDQAMAQAIALARSTQTAAQPSSTQAPSAQTPPRAEDASLPQSQFDQMPMADLLAVPVETLSIEELRAYNQALQRGGQ